MHNTSRQLATILITAILVISIGATMVLSASAHTPALNVPTTAHVAAMPSPVGVGQKITIYAWIGNVFDGAQPSGSATANEYRYHNYTLVITKPDGTKDQLYQDRIEDTTSNQGFSYTPTQAGTYTIQFIFPGMKYATGTPGVDYSPTSAYVNDTYMPSSDTTTFQVTQEAQPSVIDSYPLPTEYWTRPIYSENPVWYLISSNWLGNGFPGYIGFANSYNMGGNGQPSQTDSVGPMTSHIMWTKSLQSGGVVGGNNYSIKGNTYFEGSAYIQRYTNPLIVNGKIYYSEPLSYSTGNGYAEVCVDLRTGAQIWRVIGMPQPSFAYIQDVEDYNQHGVMNAYLVSVSGTTWNFWDADTGVFLFNCTNVPAGATAPSGFGSINTNAAVGPSGEILKYVLTNVGTPSNPNWTLGQWNSSKLWSYAGNTPAFTSNESASTANRYDWTTTVSWRNTMSSAPLVLYSNYNDVMLCMNGSFPSAAPSMFMGTYGFNDYTYFAVNLNASRGAVGSILWMKNYSPLPDNKTTIFAGVDPVNRVFVENDREDINFIGYSLDSGAKLWGPTTPQAAMDYYGSPASSTISNTFAYGYMYSSAYAGIVYCYDTKTGNLVWTYGNGGAGNSTNGGFDVPGNFPTFIDAIGQGVVYTTSTEHTIETPLYKGAMSRAINATSGQEIWTLNSYVGEFATNSYAIADGYATWFNGLDNSIYSVGRGASALTVSAPQTAVTQGNSLIISGTVMDQSTGAQQPDQIARFANGLPVASDASMTEWMGYVYQQKPCPTNFTGVTVTISVVDANGNYRTIGTTQTDVYGKYNLQWTPDIVGKYTVYATFAGTNGYWGSSSSTAFAADAAAATPAPQATQPPTAADLYFIPAIVGVIIAIIVVGAVLALLVTKKP